MILKVYLYFLVFIVLVSSRVYRFPQTGGLLKKGHYGITLYVGTPPIQQKFILDTGSSITTLPCSTCFGCVRRNPSYKFYNPEASSSSHTPLCPSSEYVCVDQCSKYEARLNKSCPLTLQYFDTTRFDGHIVKDTINFNAKQQQNLSNYFHCEDGRKLSQQYMPNTMYGIIGLAPSPSKTIIYQWFEELNLKKKITLCFWQKKGYMEIGEPEQIKDASKGVQFTFNPAKGQYLLQEIDQIWLGHWQLRTAPKVVIDSGSVISVFPGYLKRQIQKELLRQCQQHSFTCSPVKYVNGLDMICFESLLLSSMDRIFEPFSIRQGNTIYEWKPHEYLFYVESSEGNLHCSGIQGKYIDYIILGQSHLQNRRTVFDIERNKVIFGSLEQCQHDAIREGIIETIHSSDYYWLFIWVLCLVVLLFAINQLCNRYCPVQKRRLRNWIVDCVLCRNPTRLNEDMNSEELHNNSISESPIRQS